MKVGLRISIVVLLSICAIVSILTPTLAYWGWQWLVLLRLIMGAASAGVVPGMVTLIELWTPTKEASTGIVIYQFIGNIISVLTPLFSGYLAHIDWKLVFYGPGCFTLVFCLIWWLIVSDKPEASRLLSQKELDHIMEVGSDKSDGKKQERIEKSSELEWLFMFRIKEFWFLAFIWCLYCATSGSMIYLLPTYLHMVLKVPVQDVGTFTFMVQIGSLFSMLWPNSAANLFMRLFKCSLSTARRLVVLICKYLSYRLICLICNPHITNIPNN
jgi:ACS family sodium-dependent inorganic phosphate cotransporter